MQVHTFQHVPSEGLGCIENWLQQKRAKISHTYFYQDQLPPKPLASDLLIVMGGTMGVDDAAAYPWLPVEKAIIESALKQHIPVLGICLGAQLLAQVLGAKVYPAAAKEVGWLEVQKTEVAAHLPCFNDYPARQMVMHWHGDTFDLPTGAIRTVTNQVCENQGFVYDNLALGLQYHLELQAPDIERLIEDCPQDVDCGPHSQSAADMRGGYQHIVPANRTLNRLLDQFVC